MHLSEQKIERAMQGQVERAGRPCDSSELSTSDLSERGQHQRDQGQPHRDFIRVISKITKHHRAFISFFFFPLVRQEESR